MPGREMLVASFPDPEGRIVVLLARIWHGKILIDHPEMAAHLEALTGTVTSRSMSRRISAITACATTAAMSVPVAGCWWS